MAVRHTDVRAASALQASVGAGAKSGLIQAHRGFREVGEVRSSLSPRAAVAKHWELRGAKHSFGGWKSKITVSAGPGFLCGL